MLSIPTKYELASSSWDQAELDAIARVIKSDSYTMGEQVAEFERAFAEKFGAKYAVMVNSGSSANLLAVAALFYKSDSPLKAGDEVIVPSLSWSTTYYPLHQYGLKQVFVDIDVETLNLDVMKLEAALSEKTRAIFIPNILGNPAALDEIDKFCKQHGLYLLEDNCESMGAELNNKSAGTFGLVGTFSTFFSHHIATMEGGVVTTDDEEIYHLLLCLRSHGWTRHLPEKNLLCKKDTNPFYESFRFILPGYNVRPTEMSGAIGLEQLKKLDSFVCERRKNAEYMRFIFESDPRFYLQKENGSSSWFGFSFVLKDGGKNQRDKIVDKLYRNGIAVRPVVSGNFLKNEVLKYMDHRIVGEHRSSELIDQNGFFVGNHHYEIKEQLDYLKEVLSEI